MHSEKASTISTSELPCVLVIGAGLAGCEAALQLAQKGYRVDLVEQKPLRRSAAHDSDAVAELVCSNSLRAESLSNAVGLLKAELRLGGCSLLQCAETARVPAGGALAVDRSLFSAAVQQAIAETQRITIRAQIVESLPDDNTATILATGPLTEGSLASDLIRNSGADSLFFYDAIAPIVDVASLDLEQLYAASRYDRGDAEDYLNVPLEKDAYDRFVRGLREAPKVTPHDFEDSACFEGCLPIEVMAARGDDVLAFGPLKPVGLNDPRTGQRPYAVVQLRKEDLAGKARNLVGFQTRMTHSAQVELLRTLPGFAAARFLRLGSIHRNSYLDAPNVLDDELRLKGRSLLWVAGQLSGTEGYVEAIASGWLVAHIVDSVLQRREFEPPPQQCMLGGLYRHLRQHAPAKHKFTPSNSTWAMVPATGKGRSRVARREQTAQKALAEFAQWLKARSIV